MPSVACPACQADLGADSAVSGRCAFCDEPLPPALVESLRAPVEDEPTNVARKAPTSKRRKHANRPELELPPKSRVQIVERTGDRLVLFVPPGGKAARGLGCFAIFWNGILSVVTIPLAIAIANGDEAPPWIFLVLFFGAFWGVGLIVLTIWVRMQFTRTTLLLERDRAAMQKILFGRRSIAETALDAGSRAALVESYQQNKRPVHAVAVNGTDRTLKFGVALDKPEKAWIVATINDFLRARDADETTETVPEARVCPQCGASLANVRGDGATAALACPNCAANVPAKTETRLLDAFDDLEPENLPPESAIAVLEATRDRLLFELPLFPPSRGVRFVSAALFVGVVIFSLVGAIMFAQNAWGPQANPVANAIFALFMLPPAAIGFFSGWALRRGRIVVDLAPEQSAFRWHAGPLGITRVAATGEIVEVRIDRRVRFDPDGVPAATGRTPSQVVPVCTIQAGGKTWMLTTFHDLATVRETAGLVQAALRRFGGSVPDE